MKKYLISVKHPNGAIFSIGVQTDNLKPIFIYYCGQDTGKRYVNIGSAARYLEHQARLWENCERIYGTANDLSITGCSEWNKSLFKYHYCNAPFPSLNLL